MITNTVPPPSFDKKVNSNSNFGGVDVSKSATMQSNPPEYHNGPNYSPINQMNCPNC